MITIDKAFYADDNSRIDLILSTDSEINTPFSSIDQISIRKEDGNADSVYIYNNSLSLTGSYAILSITIADDLDKFNSNTEDYTTIGISTITINYGDDSASYSIYDESEFYTHKIKLLNINCDTNNIQKISKKLSTYVFLEQMLITALNNGYIDDAVIYYNQMYSLYSFGYSDVMQNIPNCVY